MPAELRSIQRRIEAAVKSLFPTTTINSISVSMHVIDDNTLERQDLYAVAECKELTRLHPTLKDYSAIIELAAISRIFEDKDGANCDKLLRVLMDMLISTVTAAALSTGSGLTVDAVLPDTTSGANDDVFNIKTCNAKIFIQNAT